MTSERGFSLVEVLVALLVLEVGLLGAVGMTLEAQRALRIASAYELAARQVAAIADSIVVTGWGGVGSHRTDAGELRWHAAGPGLAMVSLRGRGVALEVGFSVGASPE